MFQDSGRMVGQIGGRSMGGMVGAGVVLPTILRAGGQLVISVIGFSTRIFGRSEYLAYGIPATLLTSLFFLLSTLAALTYFDLPSIVSAWFGVTIDPNDVSWSQSASIGLSVSALFVAVLAPFVMYCAFYVKGHYNMNSLMARGYQLSWWFTPLLVAALMVWVEIDMKDQDGMLRPYREWKELALSVLIFSSGLITLISFFIARKWSKFSMKQKAARRLTVEYTVEIEQYIDRETIKCMNQASLYARFQMNKWISYMAPVALIMVVISASQWAS